LRTHYNAMPQTVHRTVYPAPKPPTPLIKFYEGGKPPSLQTCHISRGVLLCKTPKELTHKRQFFRYPPYRAGLSAIPPRNAPLGRLCPTLAKWAFTRGSCRHLT
jgi:hypothetical protein